MERNEADFRATSKLVALILICTLLCTVAYKNFSRQIKETVRHRGEVQARITLFSKGKVQAGSKSIEKFCRLATQKSEEVLQELRSEYKKIIKNLKRN